MKIQLSTTAIFIVVLACLLIDANLKNFEKQDRVIEWDVHSYYAYLPAVFIYNDIKLVKSDYRFGNSYYLFWPSTTAEGKNVIKTSMGIAILYAPFFFVAETIAVLTDYPETGFSEPYKIFLLLSAVFYLFVGLDYLKKTLRHFKFSDIHTAITILLIGLGTNLLCYSSQSAPMSHVYSFCLISIFIYYTIRWHEFQTIKHTLIIGFLIGLISLIRPTNVIVMLIFVFYGISNVSDLKDRFLFFRKKTPLLLLMLILFILVWMPQFIYWKIVTGHFFYYSYTGERFFFNDPKIIDGIFSFRKGWLVYTPIMAFALIGIFLLKDSVKKMQFPIIIFFVINIYIMFSWWCWWYGGSFGQRGMVDSYAIMAIPFAFFIQHISEKKWYYKGLFFLTAGFFTCLNIFQTYQFERLSLHYDGMTSALYFKQFGKLAMIKDFEKYVDSPNYENAQNGIRGSNKPLINNIKNANNNLVENINNPVKNYYSNTIEKSRKQIYLKAFNNKFVCADGELNKMIIANKIKPDTWETFSLIMFKNNECALRSFTYNFLCAELKMQNEITNTRETVGNWESFTLINLDSSFVAFKAANGKYVSVNEKSFQLFANSNNIGQNEKFKLILKPNN